MPANRPWLALVAVTSLCSAGCPNRPAPEKLGTMPSPAFVNVAPELGITHDANRTAGRPRDILEANGSGCAFVDYDSDGRLDLLLVGKPRCKLYRNEGARFVDVTRRTGLDRDGHWIGVGAADWDNDGDADLCLSGYQCGALYRNDRGRFTDVTRTAGVTFPAWSQSPAFGDIDRDGRLDLFISAYAEFGGKAPRYCRRGSHLALCGPELYPPELGRLYRNLGGSRFREITRSSRLTNAHGRSWGAMFQDYDDDGWPDLYVANDMIACDLFRNLGNGRFRNVGLSSGTAYDGGGRRIGGMAVDWADYDADGRPDLLVTAFSAQHTVLFRQQAESMFADVSDTVSLSQPTTPLVGFGGRFLDFDNDGWSDLLLANGHLMDNAEQLLGETYRQPLLLLRNVGGRFEDLSAAGLHGLPPVVGRGAAFGDYDNDGRPDALVMDLEGSPLLLRNQQRGGHWLGLKLVGSRSNRDALGARVFVRSGGRTRRFECQSSGSLLSAHDPRILVGLGPHGTVDELRVHWPSGQVTRRTALPADAYLVIREKADGALGAPSAVSR